MPTRFRELDEALLRVIEVVRDRVAAGEMSREELIHFLEIVRERIRSLVDPAEPIDVADDLTLLDKRRLARGAGTRIDSALAALNDYLEAYFSHELDVTDKPN